MLKLTNQLAALGLAACVAVPVVATHAAPPPEREVEVNVGQQGAEVKVQRDEEAATRKVQEGKQFGAYRSSDLLDMEVKNAEGKDLGKISDIVIATDSGDVRYAAMSFGGFLGLGDKMFALPWDALRMKKTDDSTYLVLNVTKEKLENAPGFDEDNWPNFADAQMTSKLDAYYGTDKQKKSNRPNANRNDAQRNDNQQPEARQQRTPANERTANAADPTQISATGSAFRISQVKSLPVHDAQGKDIAAIEDVVIDIDEGTVRYVAISFDDSWGYGEKLFALPWKTLKFQHQDDATAIVLNVSQAQMKTATGFESEDWPNFADPEWRNKTDKFYLNTPGAKVEVE
jgi:sporulation protein YlmC with PRC-barrel domain